MFNETLVQKINALAADLPVLELVDSPDGWNELRQQAEAITQAFTSEAEFSLADAAGRAGELFRQLGEGKINNASEVFKHLRTLIGVIAQSASGQQPDQGSLKEAIALADAYLQDITSAAEVSADSAPQIDEEFINELEGRIDRLEKTLFQTSDGESNPEKVKAIFREYHTLKGEAGILGLKKLSEFWHCVEEPIEQARHGKLSITSTITDALLELTKYGRIILHTGNLNPDQRAASDKQLAKLLAAVGKKGSPLPSAPASEPAVFDFRTDAPAAPRPQSAPSLPPASSAPSAPASPAAEEPEGEADDFFAQVLAESAGNTGTPAAQPPATQEPAKTPAAPPPPAPAAAASPVVSAKPAVAPVSLPAPAPQPVKPATPAASAPAPIAPKPFAQPAPAAAPAATTQPVAQPAPAVLERSEPEVVETVVAEQTMRYVQVEVGKLDQLLDLVGEVALVGSHLARSEEVTASGRSAAELQDLQRLCRTLHDMAANLRMIAIGPLFQRVQRAALDAARAVNKRVEFHTTGEETRVDRIVIDKLSAALVHMARNSVDHGIESQEARREIGKPAQGKLTLNARRAGADVIIDFTDDGKGLDTDKIIAKARKLGVLAPDEKITAEQAAYLIFAQGLSTSESVTGLSGRGVGMAVVRESAESLRGRVEVLNSPGVGVTISIRFPVALAAVETLLVKLGENTLALPVQSVRETFKVTADQISTVSERGQIVNLRGVVVPLIDLAQKLCIPSCSQGNPASGVLVLVDEGEKIAAVLVDDVLETRQVVIRPLEGELQKISILSGAALLSDRQVALVLDVRRLVETVHISAGASFTDASQRQAASDRQVETVSVGSNSVGLIDFTLRTRRADGAIKTHVFAINAFKTREFVPVSPLTPVPDMPKGFAGMLLLRSETIPVMALDVLLGFAPKDRNPEFDQIIIICEFSGATVGFLVSEVNSVSYVTWDDIHQPPETGRAFSIQYVIGTIELGNLRSDASADQATSVAFLLDFERIVQQVINLYGDIGAELTNVQLRKEHNRILLVEDSPLIRRETANALKKAGLEVLEACNGKEAIAMIEKIYAQARANKSSIFNYLDLVLSDIEMPQLDGYSLTRHIKTHPDLRLLPTLLHSSLTNETIVRRAKEVHADGFVPKCDPHKLAEHLRRYL